MFHKARPAAERNMMRYWVRLETLRLRMILSFFAVTFCLYSIPHSSLRGRFSIAGSAIRIAAVLLLVLLLFHLTGTKFAVKHSAIGRQLERFGDFNTIYREVCAAAQSPLYTNGTEVISEDYIFLMPEPANAPQSTLFSFSGRLLILSVEELESVSVTPDALYPDEMNTILFRTARPLKDAVSDSCRYEMTVHTDTAAAQELVQAITARMLAKRAAASDPYQQNARTSAASQNSAAGRASSSASRNGTAGRASSSTSQNGTTGQASSSTSRNETTGRASSSASHRGTT
ncbi:MAG: hypothetical protein K2N94_10035 [Lachnospiraceae bacterium]|nr:hypothetical protein [Lachnospiraceae bacterium]